MKKLDDEQAIEKIRVFVAAAGETSAMRRFIEYDVRRAWRNGLLPKEVLAAESASKGKGPS